MPYANLAVQSFCRRTRRVLAVHASGLTHADACALRDRLRTADAANEETVGYALATVSLSAQAAPVLPAPSTAARLANVGRAYVMREAHTLARGADAGAPYAARLGAALRAVARRPRRCPVRVLRAQAAEFVTVCEETDARFDYADKACDALHFSLTNDSRALVVPSKLVGVKSYQDAADALASRLASGGCVLCETDGASVFALGLRLGAVQPKHAGWLGDAGWLGALGSVGYGPVRVAVIAVTGGQPIVKDGRTFKALRGVNVAFEVGPALRLRIQQRRSDEAQAAIRAGRLVEAGPGLFVKPSSVAGVTAWAEAQGGHPVAWGRLD